MNLLRSLGLFVLISNCAWAGLGNANAPQGGTVYQNLGAEPTTLNPLTSTDVYALKIQGYIVEYLCSRNEDTYDFEPALAKSWTIAKDGMSFEFELREGLAWTDGKPLTTEDVKFSYDVIFDSRYATAHMRPYFENISKVEVLSPSKIKFTAKNTYFKNFEQISVSMSIIPKHLYANPTDMKKLNKMLLGTGPYILDKYETGSKITLKKNPNWWGNKVEDKKGEFNFEKIVFRFIKEENIAIEMLKKGDLDFDGLTSEAYMKKTEGKEWGTKVIKVKTENLSPKGYGFIAWNLTNPLFIERGVRVALAHLMNRELMIQKFQYNMALPATGPWYQQSVYASKNVKALEFSVAKAIELLNKAGWKDTDGDQILDKMVDGKKLSMSFTILTANNDFMKYLTIYKEDAKKAGVNIELKLMEWNSFVKLLDEKKFEALNLGWSAAVDPDPKQIWHSSSIANGGSNFISYSNSKVDQMIDEARNTVDKAKRIPLMQKVYEEIANDAPYLFLFNAKYIFYAHNKRMKKVKDTYNYGIGTDFWWIEK